MRWYVPSFYGDIRLDRGSDDKNTVLIAEKLSDNETKALVALDEYAHKKGWLETGVKLGAGEFIVAAPIDKVAKALAKTLKPGRKLVSAVRFSDGKIEEVTSADFNGGAAAPTPGGGPYRESSGVPAAQHKPDKGKGKDDTVATTVAAPTRGCPAPDFNEYEVKARRVLETFLDPEQISDFRRTGAFVSIGADTGHRYMITSRHATKRLEHYKRSLYDLDDKDPICTHDWTVPPAEELLTLHLMVSLPGWETYVRDPIHDEGAEHAIDDALRRVAAVMAHAADNPDQADYSGVPDVLNLAENLDGPDYIDLGADPPIRVRNVRTTTITRTPGRFRGIV